MSIESAKSFIERMKADEDFAKQVRKCKDPETRMRFVKTAGFDFSEDEVKEVSCALSDEEMEIVVGGFIAGFCSGGVELMPPFIK